MRWFVSFSFILHCGDEIALISILNEFHNHYCLIISFQTLEHERFKEALTKQREEDTKLLEAKITAELERQKQQLEVDYKYVLFLILYIIFKFLIK